MAARGRRAMNETYQVGGEIEEIRWKAGPSSGLAQKTGDSSVCPRIIPRIILSPHYS
jgi:hypothetical protein